jgi:hypothetical protein
VVADARRLPMVLVIVTDESVVSPDVVILAAGEARVAAPIAADVDACLVGFPHREDFIGESLRIIA